VKRVFIVGIIRFQSGEGVDVGETRDWFGVYSGGKKIKIGMREGRGCVERSKGFYKNSGGGVGGDVFLAFLSVGFLICLREQGLGQVGSGRGRGEIHWPGGRVRCEP
jgi:hypothetical protein